MDLSGASLSRSWLADSFLVLKIINKLTGSKNMQRREFLVKASSGQSLICFAGVRSELWMFLWSITSCSSPVWPAAGGDIGELTSSGDIWGASSGHPGTQLHSQYTTQLPATWSLQLHKYPNWWCITKYLLQSHKIFRFYFLLDKFPNFRWCML